MLHWPYFRAGRHPQSPAAARCPPRVPGPWGGTWSFTALTACSRVRCSMSQASSRSSFASSSWTKTSMICVFVIRLAHDETLRGLMGTQFVLLLAAGHSERHDEIALSFLDQFLTGNRKVLYAGYGYPLNRDTRMFFQLIDGKCAHVDACKGCIGNAHPHPSTSQAARTPSPGTCIPVFSSMLCCRKSCKNFRCTDCTHGADPEDFSLEVVLSAGNVDTHLLNYCPHLVILHTFRIRDCSHRVGIFVICINLRKERPS